MASTLEAVEKGETILILVLIGVGGYLLYNAWGDISAWFDKVTGASEENTYGNAASTTLQHPINTAGTIVGGWFSDIFGGESDLPSDVSSTGYTKVGASGKHWSCTGPVGSSTDACVQFDPSTNKVIAPGGPATQCN